MSADAVIYHNYFKSPNLALQPILHIHLRVKRASSSLDALHPSPEPVARGGWWGGCGQQGSATRVPHPGRWNLWLAAETSLLCPAPRRMSRRCWLCLLSYSERLLHGDACRFSCE